MKRRCEQPMLATVHLPNASKTFRWQVVVGDVYVFTAAPYEVNAVLERDGGQWKMTVVIHRQRFTGTRPTMEEAFKATDALIFKHAKEAWLNSDVKAVITPWCNELPI